jgi:hypothetical protein
MCWAADKERRTRQKGVIVSTVADLADDPRQQHSHEHAHPPDDMTPACFSFYCQWFDNVAFLNYVERTAKYADAVDKVGHEARLKLATTDEDREREQYAIAHPHASDELNASRRALVEMLYVRDADNYLTYLNELLAQVFTTRPETLSSSQTKETLEFIFQYTSLDDLISAIVEKHVDELSYLGIERLADILQEKHGLRLFSSALQRQDVSRIVETRNLLVHNRGRINKIFKRRVPSETGDLGAPVVLADMQFVIDSDLMARAVTDLDVHAATKFGLATPKTYVEVRQHALDRTSRA